MLLFLLLLFVIMWTAECFFLVEVIDRHCYNWQTVDCHLFKGESFILMPSTFSDVWFVSTACGTLLFAFRAH
jgi:hypothetical protein